MIPDNMLKFVSAIIFMQLFYSFAITILVTALPVGVLDYIDPFENIADDISLNQTSQEVQEAVTQQSQIPIIDLGALVFYSGNIVVDLILNFFTAIPQMINLLIQGLTLLFNINVYFTAQLKLFIQSLLTILYFLGVLSLFLNTRTGGKIV